MGGMQMEEKKPSMQAIESGMKIMHFKDGEEISSKKMTVEEFLPFMEVPLGHPEPFSDRK